MRTFAALTLGALLPLSSPAQLSNIRGFPASAQPAERRLEQQAQSAASAAHIRAYWENMASEPHQAGSPRSRSVALYIAGLLREWGLDASVERFEALMPYPTVRQVEMIAPRRFTAALREPPVAEDPNSSDPHQLPTFNAYAASGDVTGEVVYANFGLPADYDWLDKHGISVKGKIVLTRYGKSWRGIKPKVAAEHGAIACLIYSDPHEDGYFEDDTYPKGPMRPDDGVQRGSVLDMPLYPGDPLSPGWASEKGARKLDRSEAKSLMTIPVLPLSYADAAPILEELTGPVVPRDWRGALAITYHAGPGASVVHIKTDYDWTTKPLFDVIATIPGSEEPDRWVLAGNHHDAWVNGADDPVSGSAALLETARSLAALKKQGWQPRRTIKICFWDGEEFGLLGSTEWAEKHQSELREKAVAYLNSDSTAKGWIHISGSHTLESFAAEVASSIQQPGTNQTLLEAAVHHPPSADTDDEPAAGKGEKPFSIGALGAGSDYVAFLDFLGIASMNEGFGGQTKSGIYHSVYDSIYWYEHFSDGTFADGEALSRFTATALLRLANAPVLPFEFTRFATTVEGYVSEIDKEAQQNNVRVNLSPLQHELDTLKENGTRFNNELEAALSKDTLDATRLAKLNDTLLRTERVLTRSEGLPNRSWYKHQIYAPGFYTGYGVKTIPGVREAVDSRNAPLARREVQVVDECLSELNRLVSAAVQQVQ
ncbi:MAG TPA: transferrin receptor-like dimerization domain-containing protein [Bryobacteraceae bacterium]|jgi:N-acetylated-alpha-linked acidic dipeptidase|nr:transferrin receptor-like dimerization domain-containing protein [Bryobacteraceae bacterium]